MDKKLFQISIIASVFLIVNGLPRDRPAYVECIDSNECGKGQCCSIGLGRYSVPQCLKMREKGESCKPDILPEKQHYLFYPDNSTVHLTNVYFTLCPCMPGLVCSRDTGMCEDPAHVSFNYIDY